jgi:hypothetical protein
MHRASRKRITTGATGNPHQRIKYLPEQVVVLTKGHIAQVFQHWRQ